MRAVEKAYEAYPLDESNRYNHERNAKRVGFQQGYEQAEKDLISKACEWLEDNLSEYYAGDRIEFSATHIENIDILSQEEFIKDFRKGMEE